MFEFRILYTLLKSTWEGQKSLSGAKFRVHDTSAMFGLTSLIFCLFMLDINFENKTVYRIKKFVCSNWISELVYVATDRTNSKRPWPRP